MHKHTILFFCIVTLISCTSHNARKNKASEVNAIYDNDPRHSSVRVYLHPNNSYKGKRVLGDNEYIFIKDLEYTVCGIRNESGSKAPIPIGHSSNIARKVFVIETVKLGGDAVLDFACSNTKYSFEDVKNQCVGSFVCNAKAIKINK